jgi:hypothetical protein
MNDRSWNNQQGVLITPNEAQKIIDEIHSLRLYKDTTLGLWATDCIDKIQDPEGVMFKLENSKDLDKIKDRVEIVDFLNIENNKLKIAGCELAEAGIKIIKDYDGVHRLALAISNWFKIIANEGGRDKNYNSKYNKS